MSPSGNKSLQINPATRNDVGTILKLIQSLAEYEKLRHECVATEESVRAALFGERPYAEAVVARWDGEAVGFALFFHNFSTFAGKPGLYLEDLFVKPHARGRGVGKALLKHVAKIAHERGCGRYEWTVLDWNRPAVEFYKAMGAVPMEEWTICRVSGEALRKLAAGE